MNPESARPWIRSIRPEATIRLICFPYAGGGTIDFREWPEHFASTVDVCPIVLPGRESRLSERPYDDLGALVRDLARDLGPLLRSAPFAFFGHSMGTWIAFELARELRRLGRPLPRHLLLSARWAPHLPDRLPKLHDLSDDAFVGEIQARYNAIPEKILALPGILRMFLPALRGDFTMLDTYAYRDEEPLPVPITAFSGDEDPVVDRAGVLAWREHTAADFQHRRMPGGHFFLRESRDLLCAAVAGALR